MPTGQEEPTLSVFQETRIPEKYKSWATGSWLGDPNGQVTSLHRLSYTCQTGSGLVPVLWRPNGTKALFQVLIPLINILLIPIPDKVLFRFLVYIRGGWRSKDE